MVARTFAMIAGLALLAGPVAAASVQDGQDISKHHCSKCHGDDGKGQGAAIALLGITDPIADWTNKDQMAKMTDAQITEIITKGGQGVGKSSHMPAYGGKLNDDQIKSVIAYIRSLAK